MLADKLAIDDKDVRLMSLLMHDPTISQQELAHALALSQPSINVRLRKLRDRGILVQSVGIDVKRADIALVRVDCTCKDAENLLDLLKRCSFFVNGFLMSGKRNVSIFLVGEDLRKVEHIVKKYLRANPSVDDVELSVVVNTAKEFVCAVDMAKESTEACADPDNCDSCTLVRVLSSSPVKRNR